jgi:hypothetical protein
MLKIRDYTVYDLMVLQLQLLWVFQTACYRGKEGGVLRRQRTITLMSQKTLYFILQKYCRRHKLYKLTLCVVWLRLTLQKLPPVCEKCYFSLAEARKKRKIFSRTLLGA